MLEKLNQLRDKRQETDNGFTLIELLVVVVIIGILIAIAIPLYLNYEKGSNDKAAQSDVRNAVALLEQCNSDNGGYPTALAAGTGNQYTLTGCTGQTLNYSSNTKLVYTPTGTASYVIIGDNTSGSGKLYCYDSTKGGSVTTTTNTGTAAAPVGTC